MQMTGMLVNNTFYYFDICNRYGYCLDFMIGNSIITTLLLYVCSYVFQFCIWHRLIITANFINVFIASIDVIYGITITDGQLLVIYYFIASIFIAISTIIHINKNQNEYKTKNIKEAS